MAREQNIATMLAKTLEDARLSRNERQALRAVLEDAALTDEEQAHCCHQAFALAKAALPDAEARGVVEWLQEVLGLLDSRPAPKAATAEAFFSPKDDCARQIIGLLNRAKRRLDICVFTITDDRITAAISAAHRRGVQVRIVTDNDKMNDPGSDIDRLRGEGIPVRIDRTPAHMHHKFALFDAELLLVGSYNWTRGASAFNRESLILADSQRLLLSFQAEFDRLWEQLG